MKLHDLKPAEGSKHKKKRIGRGIGGKGGKTAGRGTKGQFARNTALRLPIDAAGRRHAFRVEVTHGFMELRPKSPRKEEGISRSTIGGVAAGCVPTRPRSGWA